MDRPELLQSVKDIVARSVGNDITDMDEASLLKDELGLDSIDLVSIVIEIQSTFDIELKNEELMKLVEVKDLLDLISDKIAAKGNAGDVSAGENRAA